MLKLTGDTWIISDTHFFHKNIIKYANRPMEHNELMEKNWRQYVAKGEDILHLGDVHVWYDNAEGAVLKQAAELIKSLPGNKYLIKGNHDKFKDEWYEDMGFTIIPDTWKLAYGGQVVYVSHHPETADLDWHVNVHGHIHTNGYPPECDPTKDYRNVSVEVVNYKPVTFHSIMNGVSFKGIKEQGYDTHKLRKRRR